MVIGDRFTTKATRGLIWIAAIFFAAGSAQAANFTINVVDDAGNAVSGFKYVVQEDTTFPVDPNNPPTRDGMLSFGFHASNQPVAKRQDGTGTAGVSGNSDGSSVNVQSVDPGRYYVSVLPYSGYSLGGKPVTVLPNSDPNADTDNITVTVQENPIPTAQIAIFLFEDNYPLNGAPDLPEEENPPAGTDLNGDPILGPDGNPAVDWPEFSVIVEEPAGLYGQNGGQVIQDAFGNPLGTAYPPGDPNPYTWIDPLSIDDDNPLGTPCAATMDPIAFPADVSCADGTLHPDENGYLMVKNLAPGKYGIIVVPPQVTDGSGQWQQTSTIEGSPVIDAWVKANEPPFFVEFGLPGPHVFMGFVQEFTDTDALVGGETISGTITNMHMSRSPNFQFFSGSPVPACWVALNENALGVPGKALFAAPCDGDSNFSIAGVPTGSYELKVFDSNLDVVIATLPVTVDAVAGTCNGGVAGSCALNDVPVFNWFARMEGAIFNDVNQNGFWDDTELPVGPEAGPIGLRWRNGTIYQEFPTDNEGFAPFDEVFPFFHWLVAEVGFGNKKATGATFVVDNGGDPDFANYGGALAPQPQTCSQEDVDGGVDGCAGVYLDRINPNTGDNLSRTETGPVLTQGFQGFLGQTSVMQFGKTDYVTQFLDLTQLPNNPVVYVGENGGISGMVHYAVTRAEDEPQFAAAEPWEPGVPRVQIALYADGDIDCAPLGNFPDDNCDIDWNGDGIRDPNDGVIDDVNGAIGGGRDGVVTLADVDNYPLGWSENSADKGPEDVDHNGNGVFDLGDAINVTWTDSWDDSPPTHCGGANLIDVDLDGTITDEENVRCFDGLRNFNQVRPGVFDGGWAFDSYQLTSLPTMIQDKLNAFYSTTRLKDNKSNTDPNAPVIGDGSLGAVLPLEWMLPADYIVEAATPPGYKLLMEEHKNVDFGDEYVPSLQGIEASCAGDLRVVPELLTFATKDGSGDLAAISPGFDAADVAAPFAGQPRPLCDRKSVFLGAGQNAAANFFLMTDVPIASNVSGVMLNDLANEFNPNSPAFGEKFAPPYAPVGFYDWAGKEVNRVYADEFGRFNALVPSSYTVNLPMPSGVSPNMLISCMNDAGPIKNPEFATDPDVPEFIIDPAFDPQFSQFCYTFQYAEGAITYLDTPVVSIAAFANPTYFPVDCEQEHRTPMISQVKRTTGRDVGPFIVANRNQRIRINSMGNQMVPNPDWDGTPFSPKTVKRNYNFGGNPGAEGNVKLLKADGTIAAQTADSSLDLVNWSQTRINVRVFAGTLEPGEYQLVVTRDAGVPGTVDSPMGVTLTVGIADANCPVPIDAAQSGQCGVRPSSDGAPYDASELYGVSEVTAGAPNAIQTAIDNANAGDLLLIRPGMYDELVIMHKPVKLQGWGAGVVTLNARQTPTDKINDWRTKIDDLVNTQGVIDRLPGQEAGVAGFPALGAALFPTEEGAGIFVAGSNRNNVERFSDAANQGARIDGITIVGATQGGAIVVNGYAGHMNIGNNRLIANAGFYSGGIRVGHPTLSHEDIGNGQLVYDDAQNDNIRIHHNHIVKNGGINNQGVGAGIAMHTGADEYKIQDNWVCGNYNQGSGGGIGHLGFSDNGLIEDNTIIFNEVFSQASAESGGGIYIGGQTPLQAGLNGLSYSPGTGTVTIDSNLIRGNLAGTGDGGGIRIENVNGADIAARLGNRNAWDDVYVFNNMITNNVSGTAGGGISIANALSMWVRFNTIANNDTTSTAALAFPNDPNRSEALPAGLVSHEHTPDMKSLLGNVTVALPTGWGDYSKPIMKENIISTNRSYFWANYDDPNTAVIETGLFPASAECLGLNPPNPANCNLNPPATDHTEDLAVLRGTVRLEGVDLGLADPLLNPEYSLLTDTTGYAANNISGDPGFVNAYYNGPRSGLSIPEFTTLQTAGAFDEGGNFIQISYGPLDLDSDQPSRVVGTDPYDYHVVAGSPVIDAGGPTNAGGPVGTLLSMDFDNDPRPQANSGSDIGADEQP